MDSERAMNQNAASYRSPKTEIRNSPTAGRGLFAKDEIHKGEVVSIRGGHIISRRLEKEIDKPDGYWGYPIADDFVLGPLTAKEVEDVMMFLNHSCEPNVGIVGQIVFVAMREIAAGEELAIDYAMFGGNSEPMRCTCGSASCRLIVTSADWTLHRLREKYKGYFSSHIQQKFDAEAPFMESE